MKAGIQKAVKSPKRKPRIIFFFNFIILIIPYGIERSFSSGLGLDTQRLRLEGLCVQDQPYSPLSAYSSSPAFISDENLAPDGYFHTVFTTLEGVIIFNGRISVDFSICIELTFKLNHRLIFFSCLFKYIYRPLCSD